MFRVTMSFAGKPVKKFTFDQDRITIGRDAVCEIMVENIGASRRHAQIERTSEGYVLTDLQSHNGTFVAGEKVSRHRLAAEDEFLIGKYTFQFEALEPVAAAAPKTEPATGPVHGDMPEMTYRLDRKEIEKIVGTSSRAAVPQLVQLAPESERRNLHLEKAYYVLGSDLAAEIKIPGLFSPGKAGVMLRIDGGWRVLSLSSKFRVNGGRISDVALQDGDLIEVGSRRFRFCQA